MVLRLRRVLVCHVGAGSLERCRVDARVELVRFQRGALERGDRGGREGRWDCGGHNRYRGATFGRRDRGLLRFVVRFDVVQIFRHATEGDFFRGGVAGDHDLTRDRGPTRSR